MGRQGETSRDIKTRRKGNEEMRQGGNKGIPSDQRRKGKDTRRRDKMERRQ